MEHERGTHRCLTKSAKSQDRAKESDVTSTDSIGHENSSELSETANSPTQPASTEETHQEKAQEIYPWVKEFRSKRYETKFDFFFGLVSWNVRGRFSGRGANETPSLLVHISPAIFQKSKNEFLECWRIAYIGLVELLKTAQNV